MTQGLDAIELAMKVGDQIWLRMPPDFKFQIVRRAGGNGTGWDIELLSDTPLDGDQKRALWTDAIWPLRRQYHLKPEG
ncbi:hypothetical protein [Bradyrhizobium diazoefficiens]|uniref:hypothetical protein n=1 Tax=Bradyrhizobium diazoefficiens TaxID=1355477 RepID=UPI0016050E19|nr:hypothetical protein [Bradyrhizobium diazoefficiens]